jgi:FK506-binding protein 1
MRARSVVAALVHKPIMHAAGASRDECKAALTQADDDEDKAVGIIVANGGVDLQAAAPVEMEASAGSSGQPEVPSGVTILRLEAGDGVTFAQRGDRVSLHYTGSLVPNGLEFDSSYGRGREFVFTLGKGEVIAGWDQGIPKLSLGEKAVLMISPDLAYGATGAGGGKIPPNAALKFEVWLKDIRHGTSGATGQREQYMSAAKMMLGGAAPPATDEDKETAAAGYYHINKS